MKVFKRYSIFAGIFLTAISSLFSQANFLGHYVHFTPKVKPALDFDEKILTENLYRKYGAVARDREELDEFVSLLVQGKKYYLYSNTEYEKFDKGVQYLEKISSKIYTGADRPVKIRIVRDPSLNACAFEDGTVYINIGLLARYNNEAELAATLGHEIGHVVKQHAYNSYKAQKKYFKSVYYGTLSTSKSLLSTLIKTKSASDKLVGQEQESDDFSIELLKTSNYNTLALSSAHQICLDLENKYKKLKEYKDYNSIFYLKTHPSSESRIKKAAKVERNGGKNFLVDSVFFTKLKQQAIDETINLYFEEQEFDQCIEMAFIEHLKSQEDPFYLFYLTECSRRLIEYDKNYKDLGFIAGLYQKEALPEKTAAEKVTVIKDKQLKEMKRGDVNSILANLTGPILQIDSTDLVTFHNKQLLNKDTLAFDSYPDALAYFKSVNVYGNFFLNNSFLGDSCTNSSSSEYENNFCDLAKHTREYNVRTFKKNRVLFVLYNVSHVISENSAFGDNNISLVHAASENLYRELREKDKDHKVSTGREMEFRDRNLLLNYLDLVYPLIKNTEEKLMTAKITMRAMRGKFNPEELLTRDSADFNYGRITPEMIQILNKYGYKGIVFSSVYINDESREGIGGNAQIVKWTIKHYYLDAQKNKVKFLLNPLCTKAYSSISLGGSSGNSNRDLNQCFFESILDVVNR